VRRAGASSYVYSEAFQEQGCWKTLIARQSRLCCPGDTKRSLHCDRDELERRRVRVCEGVRGVPWTDLHLADLERRYGVSGNRKCRHRDKDNVVRMGVRPTGR